MKFRRHAMAFTLVEMIAVVGLCGAIIALLGVVLHTMLEVSREHRQGSAQTVIMMRLDLRFRGDVHRAGSATAPAAEDGLSDGQSLILMMPDGSQVVYRCEAGTVHRTVTRADEVLHRDAFRLGGNTRLHFERAESTDDTSQLVLVIERFARHERDREAAVDVHRLVAFAGWQERLLQGAGE